MSTGRLLVRASRHRAGAASLALAVFAALGATAQAAPSIEPIGDVVVTATRMSTPLAEIVAPVVVIDRATIERSTALDAADLLRFHAGLEVARLGGPGQPTSVFVRGAESNHTLVLVDGVRINPATIGMAGLQYLSPDLVERIEVVKGPRSSLWGTDAIGGVVNVVTRRGSRDGWVAEAGYGDYDTRRASLSGGFDAGQSAELDFGVSWLDSAGFPTRVEDDTDRGFDNLSGNVQARFDVGTAELLLQHWRAEGNTEYSDWMLAPVDQDYLNATTSAAVALPVGPGRARFAVSRFEDELEQNQSSDYLDTQRDTVEGSYEWRVGTVHSLAVGASRYDEEADSVSYGSPLASDVHSTSVFAEDRIAAGPHVALLALGYTDHEAAGSAVTWNAEYGYAFNGGRTRVHALSGAGFRAPDATDLYGYGGNPDLAPEESRNVELGLRHSLTATQQVEVSAFQNDLDELIEYVVTDWQTFEGQNQNVEEARIRGVEAAWQYEDERWQARVAAIYQEPRNLTDDTPLLRRAEESLTATVTRAFGPVQLGLDVLYSGERPDIGPTGPVELDDYVLANLTAGWQATRDLALLLRVENLLDEDYELASSYRTAGRGAYFTVRYAPAREESLARSASLGR